MKISPKMTAGLIGASSSLAGMLPLARCNGHCMTCFGCAGIGLGIVLVLIGQKIRGGKEESDGRI